MVQPKTIYRHNQKTDTTAQLVWRAKENCHSSFFWQLFNLFCSCAMYFAVVLFFADVLNLYIIPTHKFADVQL
jgi:hypothetical protein